MAPENVLVKVHKSQNVHIPKMILFKKCAILKSIPQKNNQSHRVYNTTILNYLNTLCTV